MKIQSNHAEIAASIRMPNLSGRDRCQAQVDATLAASKLNNFEHYLTVTVLCDGLDTAEQSTIYSKTLHDTYVTQPRIDQAFAAAERSIGALCLSCNLCPSSTPPREPENVISLADYRRARSREAK